MALLVYLIIALSLTAMFYMATDSMLVAVVVFVLAMIMGAGLFSSK
jgi:hypothetical protein